MSTIARQIAGASEADRLAEFQRIEPNLRRQFKEHLEREGRAAEFDKEYPAILEQAKTRALSSPAFGQQAVRRAANCQCESHKVPSKPLVENVARRIAGSVPVPQVNPATVTEAELALALNRLVKPKFLEWCTQEKLTDSESAWKAKLPKLTEDFKASKHFGSSILSVRESAAKAAGPKAVEIGRAHV